MPVNHNPATWKEDIAKSVDLYNDWFIKFAPSAFRAERKKAIEAVADAFRLTDNFAVISAETLAKHLKTLPILRMSCCPPIARERLSGLARVPNTFVATLDKKNVIPNRPKSPAREENIEKVVSILNRLLDPDIFVWRGRAAAPSPSEKELERALTIVADRLCGAYADPIVRNAQEIRQLSKIRAWLEARGYTYVESGAGLNFTNIEPGHFGYRVNVPVRQGNGVAADEDEEEAEKRVNITVDVAVKRLKAKADELPFLIEAKSAGDFTNVNKRRKEEAAKMHQLRGTHGDKVEYILFLCGYFDTGYLGYEGAEGIDWVWEHRIDDLAKFDL